MTHRHMFALGVNSTGDLLIGGSFERVGGGFTRDDIRNQSNITRLKGGETQG